MNRVTYSIAGMVLAAVLGGCASMNQKPAGTVEGEIAIGSPNHGVMAPVQADIEEALAAWETEDKAEAAEKLENILSQYGSEDGAFERALLTTLSLYYLETGARDDFQRSVERLRLYVHDRTYLARETQYVLEIASALAGESGQETLGRGADIRVTRTVHDLLGMSAREVRR